MELKRLSHFGLAAVVGIAAVFISASAQAVVVDMTFNILNKAQTTNYGTATFAFDFTQAVYNSQQTAIENGGSGFNISGATFNSSIQNITFNFNDPTFGGYTYLVTGVTEILGQNFTITNTVPYFINGLNGLTGTVTSTDPLSVLTNYTGATLNAYTNGISLNGPGLTTRSTAFASMWIRSPQSPNHPHG